MSATANTTVPVETATAAQADALAARIKHRWRAGERPDLAAAVAEYPDLLHFKSVVVDLAYEEYCLLEQRETPPDVGGFCERMPAYQGSIRAVLQAHRLLDEHPELLDAERAAWPQPGGRFDGLQVVGELGRGSFARAYLVFDPETDRLCVLKVSATCGGEGRTLGPLRHPHITEVYWARRVDGFNAVCMPLLGAATLEDARRHAFRDRGVRPQSAAVLLEAIDAAPATAAVTAVPPPVVRPAQGYAAGVVAIAARIASALAYLHSHKVGHGDLKPSNVLLGPGGHPYLIDFNLASGADSSGLGGTPPYMAPEQLRIVAGHADGPADPAKADVYSLGLVLVELLTGRVPAAPIDGPDLKVVAADLLARRARHGGVSWPADASVPAPVARLVERCLADAPDGRPSAAAVAEALERWQAAPRGARRWRRRLQWATTVAAVAVLAAGAVWLNRLTAAPNDPPSDVAPRQAREPQTADEHFARGQECLRQSQPELALRHFREANALRRDHRTLAYVAYCTGQTNSRTGIDLGLEAIESGATSAAVYNNVGRGYLQNDQHEKALRYLDEAVRQDPDLQAARYNRALARSRRDLDRERWQLQSLECVEDIERALAGRCQAGELYFNAARMYAAGSHLRPEYGDAAIQCLRRAADLGENPARFRNDLALKTNLGNRPDFQEVGARNPIAGPPQATLELRLVEPK